MQYLRTNCIDINVSSLANNSYILDFVIFTKPTLKACTIRIRKRVSCECFLPLFTSNVSNIEARFIYLMRVFYF